MKHPRSCKDIAKNGASTSGKYDISNSDNERFSVYCDLQSEPGFIWTLIQSLSLSKRNAFNYAGFGKNFEIDIEEGKGNWNEFRLSLSQMQYLANHSTHLRATCSIRTTHALSLQVMTFLVPGTPASCTSMLISGETPVQIAPP